MMLTARRSWYPSCSLLVKTAGLVLLMVVVLDTLPVGLGNYGQVFAFGFRGGHGSIRHSQRFARPANPRGAADPRGRFDPRGAADPRGRFDPR